MSFDLIAGMVGISALSVLGYLGGRQLNMRCGSQRPIGFIISLLLTLLFAWSLSGNLGWAILWPDASVVSWCNLMPVLLCFTAGLASKAPGLADWHRPATVIPLTLLAAGYAITPAARPILVPATTLADSEWRGEICLQSHPSTCAPAAAATLLRLHGIKADESLLTDVCLTSRHGTEPLGLYRGLTAVASRGGIRAHVASSDPGCWNSDRQLPNISLVRFTPSVRNHPLERLLGPRGEGHAVVVLGRDTSGNWVIADPAFGKTRWSDADFQRRFTGDAIYLAARN